MIRDSTCACDKAQSSAISANSKFARDPKDNHGFSSSVGRVRLARRNDSKCSLVVLFPLCGWYSVRTCSSPEKFEEADAVGAGSTRSGPGAGPVSTERKQPCCVSNVQNKKQNTYQKKRYPQVQDYPKSSRIDLEWVPDVDPPVGESPSHQRLACLEVVDVNTP